MPKTCWLGQLLCVAVANPFTQATCFKVQEASGSGYKNALMTSNATPASIMPVTVDPALKALESLEERD